MLYREAKPDGVDITVAGELGSTTRPNVVVFNVRIIGIARIGLVLKAGVPIR